MAQEKCVSELASKEKVAEVVRFTLTFLKRNEYTFFLRTLKMFRKT